jgi:hypothetical protein
MTQTIVMVPEGHTVQVHPPGHVPQPAIPPQTGMIADPAAAGAKRAMDAALPLPAEQTVQPKSKAQPERKSKPAAGKPAKEQEKNEGAGKGKTPR